MQLIRQDKVYTFWDFIRIPFRICPVLTGIKVFNRVIQSLTPALQTLVTADFIDTAIAIFNGQSERRALYLPLLLFMLLIGYNYLSWQLMSMVNLKAEMKMERHYRSEIVQKRAKLEFKHIENNETWDLINRVCDNPVGKINNGLNNIMGCVNIVLRVVSLLAILMTQVWWAGLAVLIISAPLLLLAVKSGKQVYEANKEAMEHERRAGYYKWILQGREVANERNLFGYTKFYNNRWYEKFETARKIRLKTDAKYYAKMKSGSLLTIVLSIVIIFVLLFPLRSGLLTIGMFTGLVTNTLDLVQMMSWELAYQAKELTINRAYLKDLTAFCALSETPGALDKPAEHMTFESAVFKDVSFCYPGTETYILKHLNLTLHKDRHYAFVGVNGAGKTTITKLLTGLYTEFEGEILLNGRDIHSYSQKELKAMFSVVYQDYAKYSLSMEDNIALGDVLHRDEKKIKACAQAIGLSDAIDDLPNGIQTPLGKIKEDGVDLSGGQWQRVAIARAIYNPAPVRILDEPTAALDPVAESGIYEMFGRISKGISTIFITHRLGAARLADEIIVINDGKVAESGAHEALLQKNGIYAKMFAAQRSWYDDEK